MKRREKHRKSVHGKCTNYFLRLTMGIGKSQCNPPNKRRLENGNVKVMHICHMSSPGLRNSAKFPANLLYQAQRYIPQAGISYVDCLPALRTRRFVNHYHGSYAKSTEISSLSQRTMEMARTSLKRLTGEFRAGMQRQKEEIFLNPNACQICHASRQSCFW